MCIMGVWEKFCVSAVEREIRIPAILLRELISPSTFATFGDKSRDVIENFQ